jgi:Fe-S-cluster containining protein
MIEPDGKSHECERCGDCCMQGSPTLHLSDFKLLEDGIIRPEDLYTIRKGELAYDNVAEEVDFLPEELIKVRERAGSKSCVYYDAESAGCRIYSRKPVQCFYFECWNPKKFFQTYNDDRLSRQDLFYKSPSVVEIITAHEEMCSYEKIRSLVEDIQTGSEEAAEEFLKVLRYDTDIRPLMREKFKLPEEGIELVFGRPLVETIEMFGYRVEKDSEGAHCLVLCEPARDERG